MTKVQLAPDTTLFPVPIVLITCGAGNEANLFTLNRISSCNAEPPMIAISVRPSRASHDLIEKLGEFVVNIPRPDMESVCDYVGTTTARTTDKWAEAGLTRLPATAVQPPLIAQCPVNIECRVQRSMSLPSHSLFVAEVVALHADTSVLNERQEVDFALAHGLSYRSGIVRERPADNFRPDALWQKVRAWSSYA